MLSVRFTVGLGRSYAFNEGGSQKRSRLSVLRKKQHDVFVGGRYVKEIIPKGDNPITDVHGFGKMNVVAGSEWISPKGQRVQYYVNMDSVDHEIILPDNNKKRTVKALQGIRINL